MCMDQNAALQTIYSSDQFRLTPMSTAEITAVWLKSLWWRETKGNIMYIHV